MVTVTLAEMKNYLRMNGFTDFPSEEDTLITDLTDSAIEDVENYVNQVIDPVPSRLKISAMKIVAIKYENRTEGTNQLVKNELNELWQFRKEPGL